MKNTLLLFFICLLATVHGQNPVGPGDWSRVREYGHAYNVNDFSEDEYDWIKNHYNLFTIEKRHARNVYGDVSSERASIATAAKIIANNSSAQPLFYWNIKVVYETIYETIQEALAIHPEWVGDNGWSYDDPACKEWMKDILREYGVNSGHAGVFLDQVMAFQGPKEVIFEIMEETPGIVIYSGYTPRGTYDRPVIAATTEYMQHAGGAYVEFFFHSSHIKHITQGKALIDSLLDVPNDKIIIAMSAPDTEYWNAPDHKFSLAAYLIIAKDNSYYHYVPNDNGGLASSNMTYWSEDFERPLGPPLAPATVNGYIYTRTFENAHVYLDIQNKTSSITWIENPEGETGNEAIENLALLGTATQSSTLHSGEASRANDGNTNGVFGAGSVTHTAIEAQPWWIVDLGADYNIGEITVYNRDGASTIARLSDFTVYVLDEDSAVVDSTIHTTYPDPSVTTDAGGIKGRFVKVQLNGSGVLNLAEVTVAEAKGVISPEDNHTVSLKVINDSNNDSVTLASFTINDLEYTTNFVGKIALDLPDGEYPFVLNKKGYYPLSQTLTIASDTLITIRLKEKPKYTLSYKITDDSSYEDLSGVMFSIDDQNLITGNSGEVSSLFYEDSYEYTLSKAGYISVVGMIDLTKDTLVALQMDKESYTFTFQVKNTTGDESIQGASISINDSLYATDIQGVLELILDYGEYDYTISKTGYEDDSATLFLSKDSLLTIFMSLQTSVNSPIAHSINIYPNPVKDKLSIVNPNSTRAKYEVYNMLGKSILSGEIYKGKNTIDITTLMSGNYLVKVIVGNQHVSKKIRKN